MAGIDVTICPITNGGDVDGISDLTIVSPRGDRKSFFSGLQKTRTHARTPVRANDPVWPENTDG
ncbi:hypothetical protein [Methylosinus sp. PW1]|uniref:hypothetical protein n=1 Tax=Methylosinus sp. PW1 TaxID=107636 RepID=UPI0012EB26D8|nr:hypothetical protein [Methylosinus sp. PW1]